MLRLATLYFWMHQWGLAFHMPRQRKASIRATTSLLASMSLFSERYNFEYSTAINCGASNLFIFSFVIIFFLPV